MPVAIARAARGHWHARAMRARIRAKEAISARRMTNALELEHARAMGIAHAAKIQNAMVRRLVCRGSAPEAGLLEELAMRRGIVRGIFAALISNAP